MSVHLGGAADAAKALAQRLSALAGGPRARRLRRNRRRHGGRRRKGHAVRAAPGRQHGRRDDGDHVGRGRAGRTAPSSSTRASTRPRRSARSRSLRRPRPDIWCAAISAPRRCRTAPTVEFVWDVFTPDKQRAQRLSDIDRRSRSQATTPGRWSRDAALDSIAAKMRRRSRRLSVEHARGRARARRSATRE